MSITANHPEAIAWRKIGDIPMGQMMAHLDPTELEGCICFHSAGGTQGMQLMEMRFDPHTIITPHSHDAAEIFYIIEGSLHWGDKMLHAGGSLHIPAGNVYTFRTGAEPTRILNFRASVDHSFNPAD